MILLELSPEQIRQLQLTSDAHGIIALNTGGGHIHVAQCFISADGLILDEETERPVTLEFTTARSGVRRIQLYAADVRRGESGNGVESLTRTERGKFSRLLAELFPGIETDEDMNGGDTVQTLSNLYQRLTEEPREPQPTPDKLADSSGAELPHDQVKRLAERNIVASMGKEELAEVYLSTQGDAEILQWATDEHGLFPPTTPWVYDEETGRYFRLNCGTLQHAPRAAQVEGPDEELIENALGVETVPGSGSVAIERLDEIRQRLHIEAVGRALAREIINDIHEGDLRNYAHVQEALHERAADDNKLYNAIRAALEELEGITDLDAPFICPNCRTAYRRRDEMIFCCRD